MQTATALHIIALRQLADEQNEQKMNWQLFWPTSKINQCILNKINIIWNSTVMIVQEMYKM